MLNILNPGSREELSGFRSHKSQLITLLKALEENIINERTEQFFQAFEMRKEAQSYFCSQLQNLSIETKYTIFNSMLHMHCNRLGCDILSERRARLYASQALSIMAYQIVR